MLEEMHAHPSLGSGFGKELAFVSDDPRAREIYSDGKWRTYKFEWGWIDLWVKMGAMGFFSFVIIFIAYDKLLRESGELPFWLVCALRALLLALVVTNFFSPYLNHPLGLGILLFVTLFLEQEKKTERPIIERIQNKLPTAKLASQTPTVSAYEENT
jgi:hypothetical protein